MTSQDAEQQRREAERQREIEAELAKEAVARRLGIQWIPNRALREAFIRKYKWY